MPVGLIVADTPDIVTLALGRVYDSKTTSSDARVMEIVFEVTAVTLSLKVIVRLADAETLVALCVGVVKPTAGGAISAVVKLQTVVGEMPA